LKQYLAVCLWWVAGAPPEAERWNRLTKERQPLALQPSRARTPSHGFATVARFFPGGRDVLAAIDDAVAAELLGPIRPGKAQCFEDQYISTGGQLYELIAGHDRFLADLRPRLQTLLASRGSAMSICCHPYDLCTEAIARAYGVIVCAPNGDRLAAPLDTTTDVAWVGYANRHLRATIEPVLAAVLLRFGLA
jgi:hypothetical protein